MGDYIASLAEVIIKPKTQHGRWGAKSLAPYANSITDHIFHIENT